MFEECKARLLCICLRSLEWFIGLCAAWGVSIKRSRFLTFLFNKIFLENTLHPPQVTAILPKIAQSCNIQSYRESNLFQPSL